MSEMVGGRTGGVPALHKVRVRLPDEAGALARLTAAVALVEGNILSLAVHGQDARSVVDELVVGCRRSGTELAEAIREGLGAADPDAVLVTPADPHDLVDAPTRALTLAVQAVAGAAAGDDSALVSGLAALVNADDVRAEPAEAPAHTHTLSVQAPNGGWLVATRGWAPFTVTEVARAHAFLRATSVEPVRPHWDIVLLSGEELRAEPAGGSPLATEIDEAGQLLRACLSALDRLAPPAGPAELAGLADDLSEFWGERELRSLLVTSRGPALLVRDPRGVLVGLGSVLCDASDPDSEELVLLVHPDYRGMRLSHWLRRRLGERLRRA